MMRIHFKTTAGHSPASRMLRRGHAGFLCLLLFVGGCWPGAAARLSAAESAAAGPLSAFSPNATGGDANPHFFVLAYVVEGQLLLPTNTVVPMLSKYTGADIGPEEIAKAASALQAEYHNQGYPAMSVAIALKQITNGVVTMNVFQAAFPQIVLSGRRYSGSSNGTEVAVNPMAAAAALPKETTAGSAAITHAAPPTTNHWPVTVDAAAMAGARAALLQKMAELATQEKDTRVHVVSTNAGPRFEVEHYSVSGNSVLPPEAMGVTLTNIDGAYGTNVSLDGIRTVVAELQGAYRERGYVTVAVGLPQQKLTNATVKVQVNEGRLAAINVTGNRYFSSNNVMRALPSLHTNQILNGRIFEAELNRANANQDRQIYPRIEPGPVENTSLLRLTVKDRLPVHAKVELNNQSSPGTPTLRLNSSAVANNLWQQEHSLGLQYSFSPETYKRGEWNKYDRPMVANYSAFYRLPLGNPEAIEDVITGNHGNFGYNEATRKFNLPPPTGQPDLTVYASRATIDTGLATLSSTVRFATNGTSLVENDKQQDLTVNENLGFRLNVPLKATADFHSGLSGGPDYKLYTLKSYKTNVFLLNGGEIDLAGSNNFTNYVNSSIFSPVPPTIRHLEYLPLSLRYDAGFHNPSGFTAFGLGLGFNAWYSGSTSNLQSITGSSKSSGHWFVLTPSLSREITFHSNWVFTVRADGQWTSEPLISNEQFGAGGVNSVRGYREGEVFGDTGWHISLEQQTPPHTVGIVYGDIPLTIRGSVYMDYADTFLLDPQGRPDQVPLWGVGFGSVLSIGSHWEARFLFSEPLSRTPSTPPGVPFFNFALTGQF